MAGAQLFGCALGQEGQVSCWGNLPAPVGTERPLVDVAVQILSKDSTDPIQEILCWERHALRPPSSRDGRVHGEERPRSAGRWYVCRSIHTGARRWSANASGAHCQRSPAYMCRRRRRHVVVLGIKSSGAIGRRRRDDSIQPRPGPLPSLARFRVDSDASVSGGELVGPAAGSKRSACRGRGLARPAAPSTVRSPEDWPASLRTLSPALSRKRERENTALRTTLVSNLLGERIHAVVARWITSSPQPYPPQ